MPIAYRARDGQLTFNLDEYRLACALNLVRARPEHAADLIERSGIVDRKLNPRQK